MMARSTAGLQAKIRRPWSRYSCGGHAIHERTRHCIHVRSFNRLISRCKAGTDSATIGAVPSETTSNPTGWGPVDALAVGPWSVGRFFPFLEKILRSGRIDLARYKTTVVVMAKEMATWHGRLPLGFSHCPRSGCRPR
jgi:hypothetical protein